MKFVCCGGILINLDLVSAVVLDSEKRGGLSAKVFYTSGEDADYSMLQEEDAHALIAAALGSEAEAERVIANFFAEKRGQS